jgi:hypothetical protein
MPRKFGEIAFTPEVEAAQSQRGSGVRQNMLKGIVLSLSDFAYLAIQQKLSELFYFMSKL